jgi:hypothetical protein
MAKTVTTQSVNSATNCSLFLTLLLSTQHVSALNGHLQVSYYAKTATLSICHICDCTLHHLKRHNCSQLVCAKIAHAVVHLI